MDRGNIDIDAPQGHDFLTINKTEELVKLAYSMAIGPHRFCEMDFALKDHLSTVMSDHNIDAERLHKYKNIFNESLGQIEPHFDQALNLMKSQGRRINEANTAFKLLEANASPCILLEMDGRVHYANPAATAMIDIAEKKILSPSAMEFGQSKILNEHLQKLTDYAPNKIIGIFGCISSEDNQIIKFALTKDYAASGQMLGRLSAIHVGWSSFQAEQFAAAFNLTPVELDIYRAIVTGMALTDLAKNRSRSIGTVRQQTKTLLRKLSLKSQIELVSLYSGFSKFGQTAHNTALQKQDFYKLNFLLRPEGRVVDYYLCGPKSGQPVLFFPAILGGVTVTKDMKKALYENNIKLIMVWRPNLSKSQPPCPPSLETFEYYSDDIKALLDKLGIKSCPVVGHITSAMYAYAVAAFLPERIDAIATVNGILPILNTKFVKHLEKNEVFLQFLVRSFPKIGKLITHAKMAKIEAGYDEETMHDYFMDSPLDQETCKRQDIKDGFRHSFANTITQGYDAIFYELTVRNKNWGPFMDSVKCPVNFIIGRGNFSYGVPLYEDYIKTHPQYGLEIIENASHLALYQQPEIIFASMSKFFSKAQQAK